MRVLVVNTGSSSLKLRVLGDHDDVEAAHDVERWEAAGEGPDGEGPDGEDPGVDAWLEGLAAFDAVGHRVVHGGRAFRDAVRIDDDTERVVLGLSPLAPLHQPRAVAGMRLLRRRFPQLPQVACFDTAFHATMPEAASTYALPQEWRDRWGLQRFGFHGLSHAYAARRAAELVDRAGDAGLRVVSCHLGAGASLCAVRGGRSVDTTMGFTPLEGLVMATRSGTVDPGLVVWLIEHGGLEASEVARVLDMESGLAGVSGIAGGDIRDVLAARSGGEPRAALALEVYAHRLRRELGAMIAGLGGLDVLVFTGGVGEHVHEVRAAACEHLGFAGVRIDAGHNARLVGEGEVGTPGAEVRTFVISAREDLEIARQVRAVLQPA
jgi:acetate kinase